MNDMVHPTDTVKQVYRAISQVMQLLAKEGIAKERNNAAQGYKFRGIDDVYNALAPALVKAKLCVIPEVLEHACVERTSAKGTVLFYTTVKSAFTLVSADDGSSVRTGPFIGEAMDSGDKSANKAMSAAYKYWAMQTFAIPTEGDNDADANTHVDIKPLDVSGARTTLTASATHGIKALQVAWEGLPVPIKAALRDELGALKTIARGAQAPKELAA